MMSESTNPAFHKPSIEELKANILAELKDKPFPTKIEKAGKTLNVEPIYTEAISTTVLTPVVDDRINFGYISIESDLIDSCNALILDELSMGISGLILDFYSETVTTDMLDSLFANVRIDYIYSIFENVRDEDVDEVEKFLSALPYELDPIRIAGTNFKNQSFASLRKIYDDTFFDDVAKLLKEVSESKIENLYVDIELSNDYFWDIAKIRAMKTMLQNALEKQNSTSTLLYIAHSENIKGINDEKNLLKHTMSSLSAMIATCDGLWVQPYKSQNSSASRISHNIFNILNEESSINLVADASRGSYYIENYTREVAKNIFESFNQS